MGQKKCCKHKFRLLHVEIVDDTLYIFDRCIRCDSVKKSHIRRALKERE